MTASHIDHDGIRRRGFLPRYAVSAVCGAVFALPSVFPQLWFLCYTALIPLIVSEANVRSKRSDALRSYFSGLCFFISFGLVAFSWFWELYPLDFIVFNKGEAVAVMLAAHFGLALLQALPSSLIFVFWALCRKCGSISRRPVCFSLYSAGLWVLSEWMQTLTWAGVPWARVAVLQTGCLPSIQSASLLGAYFVTFITVAVNGTAAAAVLYLNTDKRKCTLCASLCIAIFASNMIYGAVHSATAENAAYKTVKAAAVQGNYQYDDRQSGRCTDIIENYCRLSSDAAADGAELIIWPETAVICDISDNIRALPRIENAARECGADILFGAFQSEDEKLYNVIRHVSPRKADSAVYKKQHLVPFGEYLPSADILYRLCPPLAELCDPEYPISAGDSSAVFDAAGGKVTTLICFDSVYGSLAVDGVRSGGELICISTNDSWFSKDTAKRQHNAHAVLRAVECGRYTVRAANTGISSVISPSGRIIEQLDTNEEGFITADVGFCSKKTLYTEVGNILVPISAVMCAAVTVAAAFEIKRKNSRKYEDNSQ